MLHGGGLAGLCKGKLEIRLRSCWKGEKLKNNACSLESKRRRRNNQVRIRRSLKRGGKRKTKNGRSLLAATGSNLETNQEISSSEEG